MKIFNVLLCLCMWSIGHANSITELYQPGTSLITIKDDIRFWNEKLQDNDETSLQLQLANSWLKHFKVTSEISSLNKAVNLTEKAYHKYILNKGPVCRSLARLYITQHRFCEALDMALESAENGDNDRATQLLLYDVYSELGMEESAMEMIHATSNIQDFQYLIRAAKWEDGQGKLSAAIQLLEKAKSKAESGKNDNQLKWIYSNLGDFYGHDGQIEKSREHFIKALKLDPADWYSIKGLAWIYYSGYKDAATALDLIKVLSEYVRSPDIALLEAEIHAYQGKEYYARMMQEKIISSLSNEKYGILYRMVLAEYHSDNGKYDQAIKLASAEVDARNTPETHALLAYCNYQAGYKDKASDIVQSSVYEKTSEPKALYHIIETTGYNPVIQRLVMAELKGADYELGPQLNKKIHSISKGIKSDLVIVN